MTSVTIGDPDLHIEDPDLIGRRWRTGVQLLILADASFVAALTFSYVYLRGLNTQKAWLAPHQHTAAIWVSWVIAGVLLASALVVKAAVRAVAADRVTSFVGLSGAALGLVGVGTVVQALQAWNLPFGVGTSAYSSCVYVLAGANLFHLVLTTFLGVALVNRARIGIYSADSFWQVRIMSMWWTWVAIAGIVGALTTSFIASGNLNP